MSKSRTTIVLLALAASLAVLAGGCTAPFQRIAPAPQEIVIGAVYPLSGGQSATGKDIQRGIEFAAEIVNGEYDLNLPLAKEAGLPGLKGAKIRIEWADHAANADQGAAETKRLIEEKQVVAVIGAYNSAVTLAASQTAEAAEIPFINPESTAAVLTQRGFRWFFRTTADDTIFVQNFYDFLRELREQRAISPATAAVVYENSLFGTGVGQLEVSKASQAGLAVLAEVPYSAQGTNFDQEVARIKDSNARLVMQTSYDQDAIQFMETYKAQGYRPEAILAMDAGFISPAFVEALGDDANYVLSRDVWAADLAKAKPVIGQVNDLYREKYGASLTGNSARAFTALLVLADAVNRAKSAEPARIREALLATDLPSEKLIMPWDGVKFDPATGQNMLARGIIVQIQDKAYHTVWPWELATVELVWPMPPWEQ